MNIEALKRHITASKWSMVELANELGINPSTLYRKMENGGRTFTIGDAGKLAQILRMSPSDAQSIFFDEQLAQTQDECQKMRTGEGTND